MSGDLVLVVNVRARWPEVRRGEVPAEDVVLGDWNLATRKIDPARVAAVYASYHKRIVAAFEVSDPREVLSFTDAGSNEVDYPEPRVRFSGGTRHRHLEGLESPYRWRRGELFPAVAISIDELPGSLSLRPADQRVSLAGYTFIVHDNGDATVQAPADRTVSVRGSGDHALKTSASPSTSPPSLDSSRR